MNFTPAPSSSGGGTASSAGSSSSPTSSATPAAGTGTSTDGSSPETAAGSQDATGEQLLNDDGTALADTDQSNSVVGKSIATAKKNIIPVLGAVFLGIVVIVGAWQLRRLHSRSLNASHFPDIQIPAEPSSVESTQAPPVQALPLTAEPLVIRPTATETHAVTPPTVNDVTQPTLTAVRPNEPPKTV